MQYGASSALLISTCFFQNLAYACMLAYLGLCISCLPKLLQKAFSLCALEVFLWLPGAAFVANVDPSYLKSRNSSTEVLLGQNRLHLIAILTCESVTEVERCPERATSCPLWPTRLTF